MRLWYDYCCLNLTHYWSKGITLPVPSNKWVTDQIAFSAHSQKNRGQFLERVTLHFHLGTFMWCKAVFEHPPTSGSDRRFEWEIWKWRITTYDKVKVRDHFELQKLLLFFRRDLTHLVFNVPLISCFSSFDKVPLFKHFLFTLVGHLNCFVRLECKLVWCLLL